MASDECDYKSKAEKFLDENLFPILLPALQKTIDEAKNKKLFEVYLLSFINFFPNQWFFI